MRKIIIQEKNVYYHNGTYNASCPQFEKDGSHNIGKKDEQYKKPSRQRDFGYMKKTPHCNQNHSYSAMKSSDVWKQKQVQQNNAK